MIIQEIGIVDVRNIVKTINEIYGYNFSNFALTSLKRRLERLIMQYEMENPEELISTIKKKEDGFFDQLLKDIGVGSTEMFRDPSFWVFLRDELLPSSIDDKKKFIIWLPSVISGDELFSLAILLDEAGYSDNVEIYASYTSDACYDEIKNGYFRPERIETSVFNYSRFNSHKSLTEYFTIKDNVPYRDTSLIKNVKFIKQNINFENSPKKVNLIIFRNQMIYFNQILQEKVLKIFSDCLIKKGILIIGSKESLNTYEADHNFVMINEVERIYKKVA